jgi:hypothetical protein
MMNRNDAADRRAAMRSADAADAAVFGTTAIVAPYRGMWYVSCAACGYSETYVTTDYANRDRDNHVCNQEA